MAKIDLVMPKMGESITEATILKWVKQPGDKIEEDETILEIATDKVDSEIPSPVNGVLKEILFNENVVVEVGKVIGYIETEVGAIDELDQQPDIPVETQSQPSQENGYQTDQNGQVRVNEPIPYSTVVEEKVASVSLMSKSSRFYSPLVRNIAAQERIDVNELEKIPGSGKEGRVTKRDILTYVKNRTITPADKLPVTPKALTIQTQRSSSTVSKSGNVEIIEMDRMRKMISEHMVRSKNTSPHVTSFVEADVTNLFNWRSKIKNQFIEKYGEKITYTPIFIQAVAKAIKDFPMINSSLEGDNIIKKNDVNIGMAAALPSGNLIVPVIKNADNLNLVGLTKTVNDLAKRARENKLKPEDIQGGTFTLTNVGTFGNLMGTPIINQPQVAILATGAIQKKPAVVETEFGDVIAIRKKMFLSLSYDHRIVDGFLGGSFLRKVADYLEAFNQNESI